MQLPKAPAAKQIQVISPSLYEAARVCKAKALWIRFGQRDIIPDSPNAVLGTCFHKVLEAAALNQLRSGDSLVEAARSVFDKEAQIAFERAHPLLRGKYPTREHLPHYFLQRERATAAAVRLFSSLPAAEAPAPTPGAGPTTRPEQTFTSSDGLLKGKIDWLRTRDHEIVDYKAGMVQEGEGREVSERERRQLTLYSYLARENGFEVHKGTIVRSNGTACSIDITPQEAAAVSQDARRVLAEYNEAVEAGMTFDEMAEPTKEACWFCQCISLCEKFWQKRKDGWSEFQGFGWHIQGTISRLSTAQLQGLIVITLTLTDCTGTDVPEGATVTIEQIPTSWISSDPRILPKEGDVIRIVHARKVHPEKADLFRADKALSTLWQLPTALSSNG